MSILQWKEKSHVGYNLVLHIVLSRKVYADKHRISSIDASLAIRYLYKAWTLTLESAIKTKFECPLN